MAAHHASAGRAANTKTRGAPRRATAGSRDETGFRHTADFRATQGLKRPARLGKAATHCAVIRRPPTRRGADAAWACPAWLLRPVCASPPALPQGGPRAAGLPHNGGMRRCASTVRARGTRPKPRDHQAVQGGDGGPASGLVPARVPRPRRNCQSQQAARARGRCPGTRLRVTARSHGSKSRLEVTARSHGSRRDSGETRAVTAARVQSRARAQSRRAA